MPVEEEQVSAWVNQAFDKTYILSHSGSRFSKVRIKTND